jgi:hypothetical protein
VGPTCKRARARHTLQQLIAHVCLWYSITERCGTPGPAAWYTGGVGRIPERATAASKRSWGCWPAQAQATHGTTGPNNAVPTKTRTHRAMNGRQGLLCSSRAGGVGYREAEKGGGRMGGGGGTATHKSQFFSSLMVASWSLRGIRTYLSLVPTRLRSRSWQAHGQQRDKGVRRHAHSIQARRR